MNLVNSLVRNVLSGMGKRLPKPMYALIVQNVSLLASVQNAAHRLRLHEHLAERPMSAEELAAVTGTEVKALERVLRILAGFGFITRGADQKYRAGAMTDQLGFLDPASTGEMAERAMGNISRSLETGTPAWDLTYGKSFYEVLDENPELSKRFDWWNAETARLWLFSLIPRYDFSPFHTAVDLGGGQGRFLGEVLRQNPNLRGILYDREEVVKHAGTVLGEAGVSDRCQVVGGSLLDSVPAGGDLYCLNRVLLNMDDARAGAVLKNCRAVMGPSARLLINDIVTPEPTDVKYPLSLLNDFRLHMLMGGRHRDMAEWTALAESAGLRVTRRLDFPKVSPVTIIELAVMGG